MKITYSIISRFFTKEFADIGQKCFFVTGTKGLFIDVNWKTRLSEVRQIQKAKKNVFKKNPE